MRKMYIKNLGFVSFGGFQNYMDFSTLNYPPPIHPFYIFSKSTLEKPMKSLSDLFFIKSYIGRILGFRCLELN